MTLYHYTCHHGRLGIGDEGKLYAPVYLGAKFPPRTPSWQRALLELTVPVVFDTPAAALEEQP